MRRACGEFIYSPLPTEIFSSISCSVWDGAAMLLSATSALLTFRPFWRWTWNLIITIYDWFRNVCGPHDGSSIFFLAHLRRRFGILERLVNMLRLVRDFLPRHLPISWNFEALARCDDSALCQNTALEIARTSTFASCCEVIPRDEAAQPRADYLPSFFNYYYFVVYKLWLQVRKSSASDMERKKHQLKNVS